MASGPAALTAEQVLVNLQRETSVDIPQPEIDVEFFMMPFLSHRRLLPSLKGLRSWHVVWQLQLTINQWERILAVHWSISLIRILPTILNVPRESGRGELAWVA